MTLPNDWEIRKCLVLCLGLLLAMLGLIGLAKGHFQRAHPHWLAQGENEI